MHRVLRYVVALLSASAPVAGQASARVPECLPLHSTVLTPNDARVSRGDGVVFRSLVDTATSNLSRLEIHVTTLDEGKSPHPPHRHAHEELMVLRTGTLEVLQNDSTRRAVAGSVIFMAAHELHGLRNPGPGPATYVVIRIDPHDLAEGDSARCRVPGSPR